MLARHPSRVLLLLVIAVWQLFLPLLTYAHLSKTGSMTQEVCTTMGMKTVVLDQSDSSTDTPFARSSSADHHDCCVFQLPALLIEQTALLSPQAPELDLLQTGSTSTISKKALRFHAPPTGPPKT